MFLAAEPAGFHGAQPEHVDKADLSRWGQSFRIISTIRSDPKEMCSGVSHRRIRPNACILSFGLIGDGIHALESLMKPSG